MPRHRCIMRVNQIKFKRSSRLCACARRVTFPFGERKILIREHAAEPVNHGGGGLSCHPNDPIQKYSVFHSLYPTQISSFHSTMNIIRGSLANSIRRTRWLSVSSSINRELNNPLLFHPSQSPLPYTNRPLPYKLRALSDNASSSPIHEDVKPESTQTVSQEQHTEEEKKTTHDIKDDQTRVLQAALEHVPNLGWTEEAMVAGAREVGLSPSIVGAFPRKESALVEYFMDDCLQRLLGEIESREEELSNLVFHDRIAKIIRIRLEMQVPYISKWPQALSIQANPLNLPTSFKQRAILVDEIWHAAGDRSTDLDWYAKRTLLGGIYAATELYMLTDYSPEFRNTWTFLDRRVSDAVDCRKTAQEATQLATAIGAGIGNTVQAFLRRHTQ